MTDIDIDRFLRALEYAERKGDHSDPAKDESRDFVREAYEELLDALNYLQWAESQLARVGHNEDTDDVEKCRSRAVIYVEKAADCVSGLINYLEEKEGGDAGVETD